MKKSLLVSTLLLFQTVSFSQFETNDNVTFKAEKIKKSPQKSAVIGDCGNDTVRYAANKAYYLQDGFNDPTTGGWSVNRQSTALNVVTTAYKVPSGGSVTVSGAEVLGIIMLTNYGAISTPTTSTHTVYLYNVDVDNKPTGLPIDSAYMDFTNEFESQTASFLNGPHTLTADFAIGVRGGATSNATHYLYVAYNQMHVATDATNPYGEHLSFKYQPAVPGFIDMAANFGNAIYDFEFAAYPIVTYNFAVDFSASSATPCAGDELTLTNTSTGYETFTSHSFSLSAFATRYNVSEGTAADQLPRDSLFAWYTGNGTSVLTNSADPISYTTQTLLGTYDDTLYVVMLTHDYNYCYERQIIPYSVNLPTTPTFATVAPFCAGTTAPTLSTTSTNAIAGTWSPSVISNSSSGTYTFTPTAGQCASSISVSVTVNQPTTPTFTIATSICSGATAPVLSTTSNNSITGTWSPATVDNTTTGTYTFTPAGGQCASTTTATVNILTSTITPSFTLPSSICSGTTAPVLSTVSDNSVTGTWSPTTVSNTTSGTYVFTPISGSCATTYSASVTVTPTTTPTFTAIAPICSGAIAPVLVSTSLESITGTWSPSTVSNTATGTYTFTPTSGTCVLTTTVDVTVTPNVTPTFSFETTLCEGETAPTLPSSSLESVTGTWSPATVSNTQSGVYIFTPTSGVCATTLTSAVTVEDCAGMVENTKDVFTIYPNPATETLTLSFAGKLGEPTSVYFYSAEGKLIESREFNHSTNESFDVKSLNAGVYFIQIGTTVQKIIIQ